MSDGGPDRHGPPFRPPLIDLLPASGNVYTAAATRPDRPHYVRALLLFVLTFLSTTTLGPVMVVLSRTDLMTFLNPWLSPATLAGVWRDPAMLRMGLSFSIPALTILLAHEMGHYVACRRYGIPSTLPYFLPVPINFGTFGAFIRIKAPIRSKLELFDVGIAGPIAGFVVLIPFLLWGIAHSHPAHLILTGENDPSAAGLYVPGRCLAIVLATWLFHGRLGPGMILDLHPVALAAWLGLLATAINLLPLGQLDGGHVLYAATGRLQRRLARPLWVLLGLMGFLWMGWLLWCVITLLIGLYHPPVWDESTPLDPKRRALAWVALLLLVLSFMPAPLAMVYVR
jgi:membrane-associated protease RseP (regulator of RpoE activity)